MRSIETEGAVAQRRSDVSAFALHALSTPCGERPVLASSARRPPTSTVISGAVRVSRLARSIRL